MTSRLNDNAGSTVLAGRLWIAPEVLEMSERTFWSEAQSFMLGCIDHAADRYKNAIIGSQGDEAHGTFPSILHRVLTESWPSMAEALSPADVHAAETSASGHSDYRVTLMHELFRRAMHHAGSAGNG